MSRADKRHSLIELRMVELPAGERLLGEVADVNPVRIELQPGEWIASVEMGSRPGVQADRRGDVMAHGHDWKPALHLDGCHRYEWRFGCWCGAVRVDWAERDLEADPYSAVWMDPEGREPCARCEALMAGAKPTSGSEIQEPKQAASQ